ncbi:MAG: asparaginase [Fibrobacteres bacterium]|nr:asparaginase [Fibrobacterota bacterium]
MEMTCGSESEGGTLKDAAVPLVTVTRNGEADMAHSGFACLVDADGNRLWSLGDPHAVAFFRSSAKPLQALAMLTSGAADAMGLDDRDLAIVCGSHLGGAEQADQVRSLLAKSGLAPEALGCGDGLADMCSGKHAGMLTACKHLRLPLDSYLDPAHPWQQRLLTTLCEYCAADPGKIAMAVDGCSAPTFSLPVYNMALGFARLARESAARKGPAARILLAMAENPGGHTGEPDLRAFRQSPQSPESASAKTAGGAPMAAFVTKGGANGLHCAAIPGLGLGFAMKVIDGSPLPRWPVFTRALEKAGIISAATAAAMKSALWPKISTRRGVPAGDIRLDF